MSCVSCESRHLVWYRRGRYGKYQCLFDFVFVRATIVRLKIKCDKWSVVICAEGSMKVACLGMIQVADPGKETLLKQGYVLAVHPA
jgi:hypothetical protein